MYVERFDRGRGDIVGGAVGTRDCLINCDQRMIPCLLYIQQVSSKLKTYLRFQFFPDLCRNFQQIVQILTRDPPVEGFAHLF